MGTSRTSFSQGARSYLKERWRFFEPANLVWFALIVVLLVLVVSPIIRLLWASFEVADQGGFTLNNYAEAYGRARYLEALANSLMLGGATALLSTIFGVPLAWAMSRTDVPYKALIWLVVRGAFIVPP